MKKIDKDEVFSIKKGKESTSIPYAANGDSNERAREAVTAYKTSEFSNKKGKNIYIAKTPDGHELNYEILSEAERTVTVVKG